MGSISTGIVAEVLERLHKEADIADGRMRDQDPNHPALQGDWVAKLLESERNDLRGTYKEYAENFLSVSPEFGRHLYMSARAAKAQRIVEFGTSMGVSTIYAAAALRDNGGGGHLITTEIEPSKIERAKSNIAAAGLTDLVEFRVGDARETLAGGVGGKIDLVLLDGAWSLYRPIIQLLEPHLNPGAIILADNTTDTEREYLQYVRDPQNGYLSLQLNALEKHGNEFTVRTK
ncbi:O-methyltransferase family protein [Cordyceps fumosorosea ARSEF 2679]|uniref:O-methyltransferase family protein n=1 Tax=Cordyceps fumosorosea (strain ARSEF 2679) TaxID=1081104 RepID=A0A167N3D8_CORFA|nr:O-methyltransferase family protein [Cordyceps fumosorosea ARSEF 2679]OAA55083.1 O-methyltransferase family protein [Cordyceps fumosorosea ARSEF 2679]